jgi:hypothetical protein
MPPQQGLEQLPGALEQPGRINKHHAVQPEDKQGAAEVVRREMPWQGGDQMRCTTRTYGHTVSAAALPGKVSVPRILEIVCAWSTATAVSTEIPQQAMQAQTGTTQADIHRCFSQPSQQPVGITQLAQFS